MYICVEKCDNVVNCWCKLMIILLHLFFLLNVLVGWAKNMFLACILEFELKTFKKKDTHNRLNSCFFKHYLMKFQHTIVFKSVVKLSIVGLN